MSDLAFALSFPLMCLGFVMLLYGHVIVAAIAMRIAGVREEQPATPPNKEEEAET